MLSNWTIAFFYIRGNMYVSWEKFGQWENVRTVGKVWTVGKILINDGNISIPCEKDSGKSFGLEQIFLLEIWTVLKCLYRGESPNIFKPSKIPPDM
jgi:hypothetical protein